MWHRLADILFTWYEQIHAEILDSGTLHADETSWRVCGKTHRLWCLADDASVYYLIDRSRGSPALSKFFTRAFEGTLMTDFWSRMRAVVCADQQKCWPHLLRDVASVDEKSRGDDQWDSFCRRLVGVYRDAKKLHALKTVLAESEYDRKIAKLGDRLIRLGTREWTHGDAKRLAKRCRKYSDQLLTFLWYENVPSDNNAGERAIRPAVMIRKNSYQSGSERGALTTSVLMSVLRTLPKRNLQPIDTILAAPADYNRTGKLPTIPGG